MPVRLFTKTPAVPSVTDEEHDHRDRSGQDRHSAAVRFDLDPRIKADKVEIVPIDQLKPNPRNAKKHPEHQVAAIAAIIDKIGFRVPIIVDENNQIQAGHGRWLAAKRVGLPHLPVIRQSDLTPALKRAFAIADNKLAEKAEWDIGLLAEEFEFLMTTELDFDARITGFDTFEIDQILEVGEDDPDPADDVREPDPAQDPVTKSGDIWICGDHILVCGDARQEADYATLMGRDRAQIVFADAPHNMPNSGHVSERDEVREFEKACGEMSSDEFAQFLYTASSNMLAHMNGGAVAYLCMDWRHMNELQHAADRVFGRPRNMIAWVKQNAVRGGLYRSQHELVFVYAAPGKSVNNFGAAGGNGRHRSDVWTYPALTSFGTNREQALKPVAMIKDALKDCSRRGDIVLDPLGGSGTTMIAAEATGRRARLIESDPLCCDTIVERWQDFTEKTARHGETNQTFDETREERQGASEPDQQQRPRPE